MDSNYWLILFLLRISKFVTSHLFQNKGSYYLNDVALSFDNRENIILSGKNGLSFENITEFEKKT